jgi:hypothetical protein
MALDIQRIVRFISEQYQKLCAVCPEDGTKRNGIRNVEESVVGWCKKPGAFRLWIIGGFKTI